MNDKELLEMAAKAAGVNLAGGLDEHGAYEENWNPLTDDGNALRLAVKLGIVIDTSDGVHAQYIVNSVAYPISEYEFTDIYTTTRRAITRAAAEIGKGLT